MNGKKVRAYLKKIPAVGIVYKFFKYFIYCSFLFSTTSFAADTCQVTPSGQTLVGGNNFLKLGAAPNYRLMFDTTIFNYPSVNISNLMRLYAYGNACEGKKALHKVASLGIKSARFFTETTFMKNGVETHWEQDKTTYFLLVDQILNDAKEAGVYLIPSLGTGNFNFKKIEHPTCKEAWGLLMVPGSLGRQEVSRFMSAWSQRYSFNTTILFWELGNEFNLEANHRTATHCVSRDEIRSFIDEMSTTLKSYDKNHLVASGTMQEYVDDLRPMTSNGELFAPWQSYLDHYNLKLFSNLDDYLIHYNNLSNIDFVTIHFTGSSTIMERVKDKEINGKDVAITDFLAHMSHLAHGMKKALWLGEYGPSTSWVGQPSSNFVQSIYLAKEPNGIDLASAWNWDGGQLNYSLNPTNTDAISSLVQRNSLLGLPSNQNWKTVTGDFNGDGRSDIAACSDRGLYQVSLTGTSTAQIASQWLSEFGDKNVNSAFSNSKPFAGDWDGDGKTDILVKTTAGQWYVAKSTGNNFSASGPWISNFGIDATVRPIVGDFNGDKKTDIGFKTKDGSWFVALSNGQNFLPSSSSWLTNFGNESGADVVLNTGVAVFTGDWNADGFTDIGFKTRDGRWYVSFSDGTKFKNPALWLTGYGNEYGSDAAINAGTEPIIGDWDGDNKTDVGFRTKDGRWYVAFSRTNQFADTWLWHSGLGNVSITADPGQALVGNWTGTKKTSFGYRASDGRIYVNFNVFPNVTISSWLVK